MVHDEGGEWGRETIERCGHRRWERVRRTRRQDDVAPHAMAPEPKYVGAARGRGEREREWGVRNDVDARAWD